MNLPIIEQVESEFENFCTVEIFDIFCPPASDYCLPILSDKSLYVDTSHLNKNGNELIYLF